MQQNVTDSKKTFWNSGLKIFCKIRILIYNSLLYS
jgi:hypothetical protein